MLGVEGVRPGTRICEATREVVGFGMRPNTGVLQGFISERSGVSLHRARPTLVLGVVDGHCRPSMAQGPARVGLQDHKDQRRGRAQVASG